MNPHASTELNQRKCRPCSGGTPKLSPAEAQHLLEQLSGWKLVGDGQRIRRQWVVKDFMTGIDFLNRVAAIAEAEDHHPDLHLESYRKVAIELYTHAVGGLSENDFILAAKIDQLPVALKK